ncbi:MAG: hypothetical protein B9S33_17745 [Pedosphaera sp. Tous-C6FEB]|nr:MAG: hypothetical protein B9S33_17745 [Pedosphaera sp. Tous-C6FEB]
MKNFGRNPILSFSSLVLAAVWLFTASAQAATPGAAQVKKVVGSANYTDARGGGALKEGDILFQGATITTGAGSYVDLFLGVNGDSLRVEADSSLSLNKLDYTKAGETIVNTELEVKKGSTVANVVNKLSKASKYEIKTPAGVAGIRGTALRATTSRVVCLIGTVQFRTVNGQLQLVLGGTVYAAGAAGPTKATVVESTGVAAAAASCTANSQSAQTVNQVVKQFTTVIAGSAAAEAGVAGAAGAAADAAKAVMAQLIAAVQEAANTAPPAIRAQAQAAAAQLAASADAITTASAANGAALGTIAAGGTKEQAGANGNAAADRTGASAEIKDNVKKGVQQVADAGDKAKKNGAPPQDIMNPENKGTADNAVTPKGTSDSGRPVTNTDTKAPATSTKVGETVIFVSPDK